MSEAQSPLYIFLHVPKTAGTSLVQSIEGQLPRDAVLKLYGVGIEGAEVRDRIAAMDSGVRSRLQFVAGHQIWYGLHECFPDRECRYITFMRDPVARLVSDYFKILRTERHQWHRGIVDGTVSLDAFITGEWRRNIGNHMTVFLGRDAVGADHDRDLCVDWDDALLERASENLGRFWFVGLKEAIGQDLKVLGAALGLDLAEEHANDSAKQLAPERDAVKLDSIRRCAERHRMDTILWHQAVMQHERQRPYPVQRDPIQRDLIDGSGE
jgi:hypothetical protein